MGWYWTADGMRPQSSLWIFHLPKLNTHTLPSCFRCSIFLNRHRHCVSVGGTRMQATGQQSGTCLHFPFRSTLWSSTVSTFLKVWSCHLTPPHDFLYSLCVCVCVFAVGGQRLWPFCQPLYHTSCELPKECRVDPFENYGCFQKVITGDEHLKWRATKIPQCL